MNTTESCESARLEALRFRRQLLERDAARLTQLPARLYHGTHAKHAESILRDGLFPGGRDGAERQNPFWEKRGLPVDSVFVGCSLALAFAVRPTSATRPLPEQGVVFEIDTSKLDLGALRPHKNEVARLQKYLPDAEFDAIIQTHLDPIARKKAMQTVLDRRWIAGEWSAKTHPLLCLETLKETDELYHFGPILPDCFTRVLFVDPSLVPQNIEFPSYPAEILLRLLFNTLGVSVEENAREYAAAHLPAATAR